MARTHECYGGCGQRVPHTYLACRDCWRRLPKVVRTHVTRYRHRLQTDRQRAGVQEAVQWFNTHPLSTTDTPRNTERKTPPMSETVTHP